MNQRFEPSGPLRGRLTVSGDKSVSHRAAIVGAMASEPVHITGYLDAADTNSTLAAIAELGAIVEARDGEVVVRGCGLRKAQPPQGVIDVGNAGTLMRLLPGWLAFQDDRRLHTGRRRVDPPASGRPDRRAAAEMGARIEAREGRFPPFTVHGGSLHGIEYDASRGERTGEVVPAAGGARHRCDDDDRADPDARPHRADAAWRRGGDHA